MIFASLVRSQFAKMLSGKGICIIVWASIMKDFRSSFDCVENGEYMKRWKSWYSFFIGISYPTLPCNFFSSFIREMRG